MSQTKRSAESDKAAGFHGIKKLVEEADIPFEYENRLFRIRHKLHKFWVSTKKGRSSRL